MALDATPRPHHPSTDIAIVTAHRAPQSRYISIAIATVWITYMTRFTIIRVEEQQERLPRKTETWITPPVAHPDVLGSRKNVKPFRTGIKPCKTGMKLCKTGVKPRQTGTTHPAPGLDRLAPGHRIPVAQPALSHRILGVRDRLVLIPSVPPKSHSPSP